MENEMQTPDTIAAEQSAAGFNLNADLSDVPPAVEFDNLNHEVVDDTAVLIVDQAAEIAATETVALPVSDEGAISDITLESVASDIVNAVFPNGRLGSKENPIGTLNPAHPIFWHGRTILNVEHQGSALDGKQAIADSLALGTATCHIRGNPHYKDPNPIVTPVPMPENPVAYNAGYRVGYDDADAAYQDLKNLCLAFGTEQAASTSDDVDIKYPFVAYARNNR